MRTLLLLCIIISAETCYSQNIEDVRRLYIEAHVEKTKSDSLSILLKNYDIQKNILVAYKGAGLLLKCKESKNPFLKLKYFEKGKTMLEEAINKEPNNIEIVFLRYINQVNMPTFLNYNKNIDQDYTLINSKINSVKDRHLKEYILQSLHSL